MTLIHVVDKVAEPKVKSSSEFNKAKNFFPLWSLLPHTRFEYLSCNGISCFEVWQSVWLLVVISNSEKQRLTSGKLWVFLSQKKKKSSQNHCSVEVSLGKLVNVFSNRTEKVDLTTLTITLNEKKKNPQEKYKAFLEQLLYALCTSAIWLLLFLKKRKKKIRLVPSTDHHRKD